MLPKDAFQSRFVLTNNDYKKQTCAALQAKASSTLAAARRDRGLARNNLVASKSSSVKISDGKAIMKHREEMLSVNIHCFCLQSFVCIRTRMIFCLGVNLGVFSDAEENTCQGTIPVSEYLIDPFTASFNDNVSKVALLFGISELHKKQTVFWTFLILSMTRSYGRSIVLEVLY